jgi:thiol-disulfide isomerase/thioredoxin
MSLSDTTENPEGRRGPSPMMFVSLGIGTAVALLLIVAVSIATGGGNNSLFQPNALDGKSLTPITLPGFGVGKVTTPWASGHPTVVVFYASWCQPCKEELPRVATFVRTNDLGNVRFFGVDFNDGFSAGKSMAAKSKVTFPSGFDKGGTATTVPFNLPGLPDTVFVNSNGTVSHYVIGPVSNAQLAAGVGALR